MQPARAQGAEAVTSCERFVSQALGKWLLDTDAQAATPGLTAAAPMTTSTTLAALQQLFALGHAGLLPRQVKGAAWALESAPTLQPAQVLGGSTVQLLDGCFTAAARLPTAAQRRQAAMRVVTAYSRAAFREAAVRAQTSSPAGNSAIPVGAHEDTGRNGSSSGSASEVGGQGIMVAEAPMEEGVAPQPMTDPVFLDAAFMLLSAVASRHPELSAELRFMDVAWGVEGPGAAQPQPLEQRQVLTVPRGSSEALGAADADALHPSHAGAGPMSAFDQQSSRDASAAWSPGELVGFFLNTDTQAKLAAGMLLFASSCEDQPDGTADDSSSAARQAQSAAICESPALSELCAAAALADCWPDIVATVAAAGPGALLEWLHGCATCSCDPLSQPVSDRPYCVGLLAEAVELDPIAVLAAVSPQLLCVLAVRHRCVRHALLRGLGAMLSVTPCVDDGMHEPPTAKRPRNLENPRFPLQQLELQPQRQHEQQRSKQSKEQLANSLRHLHGMFKAVGWDLSAMLQQHVVHALAG